MDSAETVQTPTVDDELNLREKCEASQNINENLSSNDCVEEKSETTVEAQSDKSENVQEALQPSQNSECTTTSQNSSDPDEQASEIHSPVTNTNPEITDMDTNVSTNPNSLTSFQEDVTNNDDVAPSTRSESPEKMDVDEDETNKLNVLQESPDISMEVVEAMSEEGSSKTNLDVIESSTMVNESQNSEESISENLGENISQNSGENIPEKSVENITEKSVENILEKCEENVPEKCGEDIPEKPEEKIPEKSGENLETSEENSETSGENPETSGENMSENSVENISVNPGENISEISGENTVNSGAHISENANKDISTPFVNTTGDDEVDATNENTEFVHVNSESEKEPGDTTQNKIDTQEIQDEEDFQSSQPQEDPIASDKDFQSSPPQEDPIASDKDFQCSQLQEDPIASDNFESILEEEDGEHGADEEQGASEELCIIPDTERVISQEEKDAATSMMPLRDVNDANSKTGDDRNESVEESALQLSELLAEKFTVTLCLDKSIYTCMQCLLLRKPKYLVRLEIAVKSLYVCDDNCLNDLKQQHGNKVTHVMEGDLRVKNLTSGVNNDNMVSTINYVRKCGNCSKLIKNSKIALSWETMEYCNETCLAKYQKRTGSVCTNCQEEVKNNCLGKYCVRFGHDIRQFCGSTCLEEYKKGLKVCSYCQKDISGGADGFLAPVKGQFKDFCSKECMEKYDITNCNYNKLSNASGKCSVCSNQKPITIEFEHADKLNLFCGDPCFVAFKFVNNITPGKCDQCQKYVDNKILEQNSMFYDDLQHSFCSKTCQNIYVIGNRKIVICKWCKVKKYNFDMIRRVQGTDHFSLCSLNCFNFYKVSLNAAKNKKVDCDQCNKNTQPKYHLTMSDATIRNFCSHSCVMQFQNQFPKTPITFKESEDLNSRPIPTGGPRKNKMAPPDSLTVSSPAESPTIPVISSVQSLAITNGPTATRSTRSKVTAYEKPTKTQIKQQVIVRSQPIPPQRNMATMSNKEVQTDDIPSKTAIIPIPIPIYVPAPVCMYSLPFPVPFPFALPIPVPIFIPTTRNSASGIMKEIKKIQVKIPTDPFEAELLMMAEMVAGDKKEENTDSESEEEEPPGAAAVDESSTFSEPVDASNTFGDDMLQMALKMATELEEPAVDLEGALTANTITASQTGEPAAIGTEEAVDDPQPIHHLIDRQPVTRGRKRPGRPPRSGSVSKRGRRSSNQLDIPLMAPPQPPPPSEPVEKPDANMCLKFTFGVNAWKQWVTTKNTELEKTSRRVKLFKPEILQLTSDELNYSLCLFVKEVRKPNGQEYAPDTIYYLCLGIQQYLFENGRIDNIFCDTYYEKFTDCLDDVARKFSVLYNDSHYIVTRVEEEHLWESKQLGAHSPHVLLSTLMFFNTKHFNLTTVDEHMQLSFSHIMKHWKRNPNQPGTNKVAGSRNVLLRFYPPQTPNVSDTGPRKKKVYEQQENEENPLRCPVKLYEFYLSKCPESVKTRNDVFYLLPERSCVPDSPVWYSTMPLPRNALEKMLHRVKMVKEINVALLTS